MEAPEIAPDSFPCGALALWCVYCGGLGLCVQCEEGQGCGFGGQGGSRLNMLKRGINGLCVWDERILEFSVFEEHQIQSWEGNVSLYAGTVWGWLGA